MSVKLILIRHGSTDWSMAKRYCGFSDISLNSKGRSQAKRLYQRLRREKIHRVYSSSARRAREFARISLKGLPLKITPELKEMNFGIFEGLTYSELMKKYPQVYKKWLKAPFSITIPQGENLRAFQKRIISIFRKIISFNPNKTIAVVSHGGPISIFMSQALKTRDFWEKIPRIGSLSIVECKNAKAKIG